LLHERSNAELANKFVGNESRFEKRMCRAKHNADSFDAPAMVATPVLKQPSLSADSKPYEGHL